MPNAPGSCREETGYTDEIAAAFDMRIAGVNHFTWMLKAEYEGRDVTPAIAESIRREAATETDGGDTGAKAKFNASIGYALYEAFGYVPTCVAHTKEYVPFLAGAGRAAGRHPAADPLGDRAALPAARRDVAAGRRLSTAANLHRRLHDHLWPRPRDGHHREHGRRAGQALLYQHDQPGAVTNMADDAFLELLCDVDMDGPRPLPVGEMPRGLHGWQQPVLDAHELTAEAVAKCDYGLLRRAMLVDPLITSIADADAILKELLDAERQVLPECWFP